MPGEKPLRTEKRTNKLNPHYYDTEVGNRTLAKLVRDQCSHHYATTLNKEYNRIKMK